VTELLPELPDLRLVVTVDDGSGQPPLPRAAVPYEEAVASGSPERDFAPRSDDDHYILYTGGTTGMPKGVVWRHQDVFYALGGGVDPQTNTRIQRPEEMVEKGRAGQVTLLPIAPLMHGATQWSILGQSFVGNRTILVPKFDPHEVWRLVETEKANSIMITGDAMGKPLVEALDEPGAEYDLSSLFAITSSAALFSAPVKDEFFKHLPNIVIVDAIGSSESGNNGMVTMGKGDTAMKSGPTVSVLGNTVVFDEDLHRVEPGSGVIGKIARYGDIPVGYYNDPVKTAEVFIHVDGTRYVMPGDFATLEADGSITLLGRGSVSINSGGEKIFPEEVESAVRSHPEVFDAIVVGAPDDRWGQRVAAIIQPRADKHPTLEDIQVHCRDAIAGYKVPRQLHVVDTIVRSPSGKPDYRWAAAIVAEEPEETDSGGLRTASGH
jgi:acyl-CoA synthetase (AMP-forming)/AMP-acid ligase II